MFFFLLFKGECFTCTSCIHFTYTIHIRERDISLFSKTILIFQIESLTLTFHGHDLIVDSSLELNYGRYYELQNHLLSLYATLYLINILGLQICTR